MKSLIPVMRSVSEDFVKFVRSYPSDADVNAKEVRCKFY